MSESINIENKKQNHLKPPRSLARIACEILAGTATGLAVALPLAYVIGIVLLGTDLSAVPGFRIIFAIVFPKLYGLGSVVGVYLLGTRGKQTGSFLLTLVGGFLGGFFMPVMLPFSLIYPPSDWIVGVDKIVLSAIGVLIFLSPPIFATIGFNLRRRYK